MAIPTQKKILVPLLKSVSDGKEHHVNDIIQLLARHFDLSENEINQQYPSGIASTS